MYKKYFPGTIHVIPLDAQLYCKKEWLKMYDKTVTRTNLWFILCYRKLEDITSNQPAGRIELDSTCKTLSKHKYSFVIFARTL